MLCGKHYSVRKVVFGVVLLILIGVGGGILLWKLLPQRQREQIASTVEDSAAGLGKDLKAPPPDYQFIQCTNNTLCCNGLASNCNLKVIDIMYAGIHNGNAAAQNGFRVAPNHLYSLESSLDYGYRAINMDIGNCDGVIKLVHGKCKLGTRDPYEVFTNINSWLDNNPTEVLIITIQIDGEAGGLPVKHSDINEVLISVNGFSDKMWAKGSTDDWPKLLDLVESNHRVLFFTYNGEKCYDSNVVCPTGFMDWFRYAAETQYSFKDSEELLNVSYSCTITRGRPLAPFFALNAFVTLPSMTTAGELVNRKEFLTKHIEECSDFNNGRSVNIVFLDFWHEGNLPEVVQIHNSDVALDFLANQTNGTSRRLQTFSIS